MFMPKAHRVAIYEYLFKEGVLIAQKDLYANHPDLETIPNLHVIKTMQPLKSKGFVKEQFAWRHYYWFLTNEGIEYLRGYLHLPAEMVPTTLKRAARSEPQRARAQAGSRPDGRKGGDDGQSYRRMQQAGPGDKKGDLGAGAGDLEFRGGFGHGSLV